MKNYKQFLDLAKQIKKYADGGDVDNQQTPLEAGIEAKARREAVLRNAGISATQSPEEVEIEAAEKRRRELESFKKYASGGPVYRKGEFKNEDLSDQGLQKYFGNFDDGGPVDPLKEDNGQVQESQQKQYQAKDYFGKGANGAGEGVANSMGIAMTMSDGGDVSSLQDLSDKIRQAFSSPPAQPEKHAETQDEKYARIRKENTERASGKRPTSEYDDPDYNTDTAYKSQGGMIKKYADGGAVVAPTAPGPSGSANTASSLSPILKESYAGRKKKLDKDILKMSSGGWAPEQVQKLPKTPAIHEQTEKKYALNIPRAPRISIPKRLKSISDVRGYADGTGPQGVQPQKMDLGDIDITPSTPYPGEEEDAQKTVDQSTQGQIQQLIDQLKSEGAQSPQDQAASQQPPVDQSKARNLEGMTLSKDDALKENPDREIASDDQDLYKGEEEKAQAAADKAPEKDEEDQQEVKPKGFDPIAALRDAQQGRDKSQMFSELGAISDRGAAQMAGIQPTQQQAYKDNMAIAQQAVDDVKDRIKQQGDDPNSNISQTFRQYLEKFSGHPVDEQTTANTGKEILPIVFKDFEAKQASEARQQLLADRDKERLEQMQMLTQSRRDIARENMEMKKYLAQLQNEGRLEQGKQKAEEKDSANKDKVSLQTGQLLEQMRGSPAAGQAEKDYYNVQKANSLANLYSDPNKMSPQQVRLLATEVSKIASGGAPTMEELKTVDPSSFRRELSTVIQKFTNSPSPANAADFVKQYQDYTKALSKDSQKVITDRYKRIIEPRKKQLGDEHYKDLQDQYLNRFDESEQPAAQQASGKQVVRKGYNKATNQTQLIYSDGTSEIKDGKI